MDRFILKANGSKIKSMGTPLFTSKVEKKMAEGCFNEGVFSGKGAKFYENGNKRIEGEWANGKQQQFYYFIRQNAGICNWVL